MNCRAGIVMAIALLAATGSLAAERPLTLGVRMNALHASGDMTGGGLSLGLQLRNSWFAVATVDSYRYAPDGLVDAGPSAAPGFLAASTRWTGSGLRALRPVCRKPVPVTRRPPCARAPRCT